METEMKAHEATWLDGEVKFETEMKAHEATRFQLYMATQATDRFKNNPNESKLEYETLELKHGQLLS